MQESKKAFAPSDGKIVAQSKNLTCFRACQPIEFRVGMKRYPKKIFKLFSILKGCLFTRFWIKFKGQIQSFQ